MKLNRSVEHKNAVAINLYFSYRNKIVGELIKTLIICK
jgi:hypothetical protein